MEPSTQTSNYDDPQVATQAANMTRAIFQHESGTNYNAQGDAGTSKGAGQWQDATWKAEAKDVLGDENAPMTQQNQSVVAQGTIRKWIKQGYNAAQIAAMWNSGSPDGWENKIGKTVINGQTISYNVPKYVKDVTDLYQQYKQQNPQTQQASENQLAQASQSSGNQDWLDKLTGIMTSIFPGTKQIGQSVADTVENIGKLPGEFGKLVSSAPGTYQPGFTQENIPQTVGGYLQSGSIVAAPESGGGSALSRVGSLAGLGAVSGVGAGLASNQSAADVAKSGATGALLGGGLGTAGEAFGKLAQYLPYRMVRTFVPGIDKETAQYAVNKGVGTIQSMANKSDRGLTKVGRAIEEVLSHPNVQKMNVTPAELMPKIAESLPNAGLSTENVQDELMSLIPNQKTLISKFFSSGLNPKELNQLKSALGEVTFKTRFDAPSVKAGKDVGNAIYQSIKDWFPTHLPPAQPLFDEWSKEFTLNKALQAAIRRGEKARPVTLKDLVAITSGLGFGGPMGAVGALLGEKVLTDPRVNLGAMGVLQKLGSRGAGAVARTGASGGIANLLGMRGQSATQ